MAQPSFADDREKVIGIWKLVSQEICGLIRTRMPAPTATNGIA
jgi:hypothetical protein